MRIGISVISHIWSLTSLDFLLEFLPRCESFLWIFPFYFRYRIDARLQRRLSLRMLIVCTLMYYSSNVLTMYILFIKARASKDIDINTFFV